MHGIISELVQRIDDSQQLQARVDHLQAEVSQLQKRKKKLAEATAPTPKTSSETGSSSFSDLEDIIRKVNLEERACHPIQGTKRLMSNTTNHSIHMSKVKLLTLRVLHQTCKTESFKSFTCRHQNYNYFIMCLDHV